MREALLAKAEHLVRLGDRAAAEAAFEATAAKTVAVGQKMDLLFSLMRLHFLFFDYAAVKADIRKVRLPASSPPQVSFGHLQLKDLLETPGGGDWERKNRLKVYEGVWAMATRDFAAAAGLLLDSLATFSASELCSYPQFVFYTLVTAVVALDRVALKARVIDTPEILAVLGQLPHMDAFLNGLYSCRYKVRSCGWRPCCWH